MPHLVDCPGCACLIDATDHACPFCGHVPRRVGMSGLLSLGFVLGMASTSCGEKKDDETGSSMSAATTTSETDGATDTGDTAETGTTIATGAVYAGPTAAGETTIDTDPTSTGTGTTTTMGGSTAYALPPEWPKDEADRDEDEDEQDR